MSNIKLPGGYAAQSKLDKNAWITDPTVPDPDNLPEPLGWTLLVRPYPVKQDVKISSIILPEGEVDFMSTLTNIARVVAIGPSCWNRSEHKNEKGEKFNWVEVGDFVSYPKNTGARRKFKGVTYVLLCDDEIVERLSDPQVFDDDFYVLDIPEEDLKKYNTIYNKEKQ